MTNDLPTVVLVHGAFANANSNSEKITVAAWHSRPSWFVIGKQDGLDDVPADLTGLAHKGVGASSGT
jgi:hypothetical protein